MQLALIIAGIALAVLALALILGGLGLLELPEHLLMSLSGSVVGLVSIARWRRAHQKHCPTCGVEMNGRRCPVCTKEKPTPALLVLLVMLVLSFAPLLNSGCSAAQLQSAERHGTALGYCLAECSAKCAAATAATWFGEIKAAGCELPPPSFSIDAPAEPAEGQPKETDNE